MQKSLLSWLFVFSLFVATIVDASAQAMAPGEIKLARVRGTTVTYKNKATQQTVAAQNNAVISQGYVINTGADGSVVLVFSNGATINLKEGSELDIEAYLQAPLTAVFNPATATEEPTASVTTLNLTRGELIGNVKKLNKPKGSSFDVKTPVGAAGIRGTTFRIVYRPTGTGTASFSITISEGSVELVTGTVTVPVAATANGQAQEVVFDLQVNVVTGVATITTPAGAIFASIASPTSNAAVVQGIQEVAQVIANVLFVTPATNPNPPAPNLPTPTPTPQQPEPPPPPPIVPAPRTTNNEGNP